MSGIKLRVKSATFPKWKKIHREMQFAYAQGLTRTAEEGRRAAQLSVKKKFKIRRPWWKASNKMGIRVRAARYNQLWAATQTNADFLSDHEKGAMRTFTSPQERTGRGHHGRSLKYRSIPTFMKLSARRVMLKSQKPARLLKQKKVFVRKTPRGFSIYRRRGKKGERRIEKLFILRKRVVIRRRAPFAVPIKKAMKKHYKRSMNAALVDTMRKLNPDFRRASRGRKS